MRKCESPRVCSLVAPVSGEPPARDPRAAPSGPASASRRQVDFPSRLHFWPADLRRDQVEGLLEGDDVLRTGEACKALGAAIERLAPGRWRIRGPGLGALVAPRDTLDFGNAGTGSRLMMGVVGSHGITATFDGDASLRKRPMGRILDPLRLMGAEVLSQAEGGRCPIVLKGVRDPAPILYRTPVASAQIKSAVLLAGLNARGVTTVDRSGGLARPYREDARAISAPRSRSRPRARGAGSTSSAARNSCPVRSSCRPIRRRRRSRSSRR